MYFVCYRFRGFYRGDVHSQGMVTGDSGMMKEFKAMIGVQIPKPYAVEYASVDVEQPAWVSNSECFE